MSIVLELKWNIVRYMTLWPVSLVHTLSSDPLRILTDVIFSWSRQRYASIIRMALSAYDRDHSSGGLGAGQHLDPSADMSMLLWTAATIFAYALIGFIWCHVKLFIDVWQGTLPPAFEKEVRAIYAGDKNYWQFALKIKWLVISWLVTWPFSIAYTLLRHPFRIVAEMLYKLQQRKFVWIIKRAMDAREKQE